MPDKLYDKEEIEAAFFNYDSDGGESHISEWEQKCREWAKFWAYLENYKTTAAEHPMSTDTPR